MKLDQIEMVDAGVVQTATDILVDVLDRKSTRLNSSHLVISYAVFCLKKKNIEEPVCTPTDARAAGPESTRPLDRGSSRASNRTLHVAYLSPLGVSLGIIV